MKVIESISKMQTEAQALRAEGKRIALVPTMGSLHEGHLSLVGLAKKKADVVVLSIFVNPKQFAPNEDFARYPRDRDRDRKFCKEHGIDIIFAPKDAAMYPETYSTYVDEGELSMVLCGVSRPGHFRGVCTVVAKLFNNVQPHVAVFGQKDAQQVAIIKRMVRDLHFPVQIVVGPTAREEDGLALSSRNVYFTPSQRLEASKIYESLQKAKEMVASGMLQSDRIVGESLHHLTQSLKIRVIYVSLVERGTLKPLRILKPGHSLLAVAVWLDGIRLIDNIEL